MLHKHSLIESLGPIFLSALSFCLSMTFIVFFSTAICPEISLFANSGWGKALFMAAGIWQAIVLVLFTAPIKIIPQIWHAFSWPASYKHIKTFLWFTALFSIAHCVVLFIYFFTGNAELQYSNALDKLMSARWYQLLLSLLAPATLAWSEEFIFRGVTFSYLRTRMNFLSAALLSSFVFMIVHDLSNPLNLLTRDWQLGVGLFLLGLFLTYVMSYMETIAASAGAHAGLVFIKVVLRKFPLLVITENNHLFFPEDLRMSVITHLLLLGSSIYLNTIFKQKQ